MQFVWYEVSCTRYIPILPIFGNDIMCMKMSRMVHRTMYTTRRTIEKWDNSSYTYLQSSCLFLPTPCIQWMTALRSNLYCYILDCGGKMCYNGGTLDYNTCTCSCQGSYTGASCQNSKWHVCHIQTSVIVPVLRAPNLRGVIQNLQKQKHGKMKNLKKCSGNPPILDLVLHPL